MSSELNTRRYLKGDEVQIVPLLVSSFGRWPFFEIECTPIDHWIWRYVDKPGQKSIPLVVTFDNTVVGSINCIQNNYLINGKQYIGSYGTDGCVHPDYRRRGIHTKMVHARVEAQIKEGIDFGFIVSDNPIVINAKSRRMTHPYEFPFNISYLSWIDNIEEHERKTDSKQFFYKKMKHRISQVRNKPISSSLNPNIEEIHSFTEDFKLFLEKNLRKYDFILLRNRDYLNWRYFDPRAGEFISWKYIEKGELVGYCIVKIRINEDYPTGYLVDLLTYPERLDIAESLLVNALHYFRKEKVNNVIYQVVKDHPYEAIARKYGFMRVKLNPRIFFNSFGAKKMSLEKIPPNKVHFSMGDMTET